jgi:hypothetical protein
MVKDTKGVNRSNKSQTIQWLKDTKGVNRSNKSNDRQYNGQKIPKE